MAMAIFEKRLNYCIKKLEHSCDVSFVNDSAFSVDSLTGRLKCSSVIPAVWLNVKKERKRKKRKNKIQKTLSSLVQMGIELFGSRLLFGESNESSPELEFPSLGHIIKHKNISKKMMIHENWTVIMK